MFAEQRREERSHGALVGLFVNVSRREMPNIQSVNGSRRVVSHRTVNLVLVQSIRTTRALELPTPRTRNFYDSH